MNVLEHIQNDQAAVADFVSRLKPDGSLIILVPAVPSVFGRIDERLGHYRRYSKAGLHSLLTQSGLMVEKLRFFNFVGLLGWWWNTKVAKREKQSDTQILFFDRFLVPWLSAIEKLLAPPIGQSLLAVGRKAGPNSSPV